MRGINLPLNRHGKLIPQLLKAESWEELAHASNKKEAFQLVALGQGSAASKEKQLQVASHKLQGKTGARCRENSYKLQVTREEGRIVAKL